MQLSSNEEAPLVVFPHKKSIARLVILSLFIAGMDAILVYLFDILSDIDYDYLDMILFLLLVCFAILLNMSSALVIVSQVRKLPRLEIRENQIKFTSVFGTRNIDLTSLGKPMLLDGPNSGRIGFHSLVLDQALRDAKRSHTAAAERVVAIAGLDGSPKEILHAIETARNVTEQCTDKEALDIELSEYYQRCEKSLVRSSTLAIAFFSLSAIETLTISPLGAKGVGGMLAVYMLLQGGMPKEAVRSARAKLWALWIGATVVVLAAVLAHRWIY